MGLPIIQEIWDGIRWLIDFFINKAPRPLKIIIFLLFLIMFGSIISFALHISGVHCKSDLKPVKVDMLKVGTNFKVMLETRDEILTADNYTLCEVHPELCGNEHDAYFFARKGDNGFYYECNQTNPEPDCSYLYKYGNCHNCTEQEICFQDALVGGSIIGICGKWHSVCLSDAYPDRKFYDTFADCSDKYSIPENYYFDNDTGLYVCSNTLYCGATATLEPNTKIDEILENAGAEYLYPTTQEDTIENIISVGCSDNLNPRLYIFGLDLFSYVLWFFIILIYVLIEMLIKIKNLTR